MHSSDSDSPERRPKEFWRHLAIASGIDFLDQLPEPQKEALALLSKTDAIQLGSIPLNSKSDTCRIAISDPMNFEVLDSLSFLMKREITFVAATPETISHAIACYYA